MHKQETAARAEIGAAPRFRAKAPPVTYRYDSSLAPALDWNTNPARETAAFLLRCSRTPQPYRRRTIPEPRELKGADGAALLRVGGLQDAVATLKRMQTPFLNWAGKAERQTSRCRRCRCSCMSGFPRGDPRDAGGPSQARRTRGRSSTCSAIPDAAVADQVEAYRAPEQVGEPADPGRFAGGDELAACVRGLGGQVQMIYIDPPYGVKFGCNFQPFVRKRDVSHGDDEDMTREPEMVQAYRDTWELGLHSYLTYLRDRLMVARDLLTTSGSVFVQISDENLHHVRELMDEIFGAENFVSASCLSKTSWEHCTTLT